MENTPRLNLKKPVGIEYVNIHDLNANSDAIDQFAIEVEGKLANVPDLETSVADLILQVGSLTNLSTVEKANLVSAINEVYTNLTTHQAEDAKRIKVKQGVIITAVGWTLNPTSNLYEYRVNDSDIFSDTIVDINIKVSELEKASDLLPSNESFNGYVNLYSEAQPTENISCDLKLIRQVF